MASAAAPPTATTAGRWAYTGEIMVSKVFPAGFGWQFSSGVAEEIGFGADTAGFALTTGLGDAAGVFLGHSIYKAAQSLVSDKLVSGSGVPLMLLATEVAALRKCEHEGH